MGQYDTQAKAVMEELVEKANIKPGNIVVIGCSTSEVLGSRIGTNSSPEAAKEIFDAFHHSAQEYGFYLATERKAVPHAQIVNVVPQPKAGGSLATAAYKSFEDPVALEEIQADAGLDIGCTLIGMHLKKVAVPVRLEHNHIGDALVIAARTRPKFIGGVRAIYDEDML